MFHLPSCETSNTELAAALASVGIPLKKECPVRILTGHGGDRHCFFFEEISPCGQFKTGELIQAWHDPEWHKAHPRHPFAYVKVAFKNKHHLTDYVRKGVPIAVEEKSGKLAFLPLNASDELQKKVFQKLNSRR